MIFKIYLYFILTIHLLMHLYSVDIQRLANYIPFCNVVTNYSKKCMLDTDYKLDLPNVVNYKIVIGNIKLHYQSTFY